MAAAVNKDALHLLLMMVGGGSESKLSGRGGRCGGVLFGAAFVLGPRRRGDAGSGVVAGSWSLYRSFAFAGTNLGPACLGAGLWLLVGVVVSLSCFGLSWRRRAGRGSGMCSPPMVDQRWKIPASVPDESCGIHRSWAAIESRLASGVRCSRGVLPWRRRVMRTKSTLDPSKYGDHTSTITAAHIEKNLEGLTVQKALESNKLYILDHHDRFMPFLIDVNNLDGNFIYATRTLFFLRGDGRLTPLAIELSEPFIHSGLTTAKSKVYTPVPSGSVEGWVWELAKAYVAVGDSGWHQLVSHWLNTHAVMEPFVISTNRHLSVTHSVHKLLSPHYRDTMTINALARQTLINAGGIFEMTVFPGKFALGMSSVVYKNWNFTEQGLPDDLIKRGVAVEDLSSPYKVRLLIKDYPYAADGLAIWHAIEQYVNEYLAIYYPDDGVLRGDVELQAWWKETREVGHGDLKDAPWWPKMQSVAELAKSCTTIIWIASALHAAVNFGQYPYAGYLPNRPTVSRRRMPEPGTDEYAELGRDPERAFIHTITSQIQTIIGISLLEVLSKHSSDELYLGQRDTPEWTSDPKALVVFKRFSDRLLEIKSKVVDMNQDPQLKNRNGPAKLPYMLLYPNTSDHKGDAAGLTAKGIPNSISI